MLTGGQVTAVVPGRVLVAARLVGQATRCGRLPVGRGRSVAAVIRVIRPGIAGRLVGAALLIAGSRRPGFLVTGVPVSRVRILGAGYLEPSYSVAGYLEPSYSVAGYPEPGYSVAGYPEPGCSVAGYPEPGYSVAGYPEPGCSS